MVHESWHAAYDDGGSVDSFEVELHYDIECEQCSEERHNAYMEWIADKDVLYPEGRTDELPF